MLVRGLAREMKASHSSFADGCAGASYDENLLPDKCLPKLFFLINVWGSVNS